VDRAAGAAVDWPVDLVHGSMVDRGQGGNPRSNLDRRSQINRLGWPVSGMRRRLAGDGGGSPEFARSRATGLRFECGLDQEEEKDGVELTRGLLMAVEQRSSRALATGSWDRGHAWRMGFRTWVPAPRYRAAA
jgi:hypothetical protein